MHQDQPVEAVAADQALTETPDAAAPAGIYRFTSIGRPLDPAWLSNKAVLLLLPIAALGGLVSAWSGGQPFGTSCVAGLVAALSVFGTWALGRELLPDDHAAAFVSMALGFLAALSYQTPGLLPLFSSIALVRIVNRSTGLMPRYGDSALVVMLVIFAIYQSGRPWLGAVAALAFFLDGVLRRPAKKQWLFALISFGAMVVYMVDHDVVWWQAMNPDSLVEWLAVLALLLLTFSAVGLKKVHARGDIGQARLDVDRVRGGMAIGILATLLCLDAMPQAILLVSTIAGLGLGITFRRAFRKPTKGLRAS